MRDNTCALPSDDAVNNVVESEILVPTTTTVVRILLPLLFI